LTAWAKKHLAEERYDVAYAVPASLMEKMSDKEESPELIAVGEMQLRDFLTYELKGKGVVVVLDEPKSAGNVGMVIRSAVAFGASCLVLSGHAADEYDPKCIRASVGTFFSLPIYRVDGIGKFLEKIAQLKQDREVKVIASGNRGDAPIQEVSFTSDLLFLVLGNETHGVSVGYRQNADQFVQIPLEGKFTSLNVGAAASIFLYEIFRQRQAMK
jgi:TrmH family RNA methyltransferase